MYLYRNRRRGRGKFGSTHPNFHGKQDRSHFASELGETCEIRGFPTQNPFCIQIAGKIWGLKLIQKFKVTTKMSSSSSFEVHNRWRNLDAGLSNSATNRSSRMEAYGISHVGGFCRGKAEYYNGEKIAKCHCQESCRIVSSWTAANPSRRFHGCRNYGVMRPSKCLNFNNLCNG